MFNNAGISGATIANYDYLTNLGPLSDTNEAIALINIGINDIESLPAEATWKANYLALLDYVKAKWPNVVVYIARPWRRDYDSECETLATWISDIVALRAFTNLGIDEAVTVKGSDNGTTNTSDGVHYSAAGTVAITAAWLDVLT